MKSFIFLLFIFLIANLDIIHTQTRQAAQIKLNYLGNTIYLDTHQDFKQNNFVLETSINSGSVIISIFHKVV